VLDFERLPYPRFEARDRRRDCQAPHAPPRGFVFMRPRIGRSRMAAFRFHLCSLLGNPDWWNPNGFPASAILQDYFRDIIRLNRSFDEVQSWLMPTAEFVKPADLLVYIVSTGNSFNSIVARKRPDVWTPNPQRSGLTVDIGQNAVSIVSEVYWDRVAGDRDQPRLLANLIFHEFMHNKLDAVEHSGTDFVHRQGGGGLAVATPLSSDMRPNQVNNQLMAAALGRNHPQHTGDLRRSDIPPGRPLNP
jgi:hypothetical protein